MHLLKTQGRFDDSFTSVFFTHAATQPAVNAEKLLALMRAGIVEVVKLGENYHLANNDAENRFNIIYRDAQGKLKTDTYRYVVTARGQEKSLETNPSALAVAKNILKSGVVKIEEIRPADQANHAGLHFVSDSESAGRSYKTGSIWIDPANPPYHAKGA